MIKRIWKGIGTFSANRPVILALLIAVVALGIVVYASLSHYSPEFYENILVEAHGMLLDLVIIGVLVYSLNILGERQRNIQRYREEIQDYLGWNEPEATYRIVGNIRRLNREGITDINLIAAYLQRAKLQEADLQRANLQAANLQEADLQRANLQAADLQEADLQRAILSEAKLQEADLRFAKLQEARLFETNLQRADLHGAYLQEADLQIADLQGAKLETADLRGADLRGANLREASLQKVNLKEAIYNNETSWPRGFNATEAGANCITYPE